MKYIGLKVLMITKIDVNQMKTIYMGESNFSNRIFPVKIEYHEVPYLGHDRDETSAAVSLRKMMRRSVDRIVIQRNENGVINGLSIHADKRLKEEMELPFGEAIRFASRYNVPLYISEKLLEELKIDLKELERLREEEKFTFKNPAFQNPFLEVQEIITEHLAEAANLHIKMERYEQAQAALKEINKRQVEAQQ